MAKNKHKKAGAPVPKSPAAQIELVPVIQAPQREGFDITKWRQAMRNAEDPLAPRRTLLYDIYTDIMLDLHLTAVIEKRIENVKGTQIVFIGEDGKNNESIDGLIDSPWFNTMLGDILEARFYGYTAAWIDLSGGVFHKYKKYDRRHIVPEKGIFVRKPEDRDGVNILEPPYSNYILTAGETNNLGMLIKAAAWVLLKRGDISDWATFNEIFAAPIRKGSYPDFNPEVKKEMAKAIAQQGAMSWYLIPESAKLELVQSTGTGSTTAYSTFADFCDKQLSKGFLHATMTLDAEGGQYKGDIHENSESAIHQSDRRQVLNVLNTTFRAILEAHGFKPGAGKFQFIVEERVSLKDRLDMDMKLNEIIDIPAEYFYNKYNVPIPESGAKKLEKPQGALFREKQREQRSPDPQPPVRSVKKKEGFDLTRFFG